MITAGLTGAKWNLRRYDVPLLLGKGELGFVKHERMTL
jgi:hypothetical protein